MEWHNLGYTASLSLVSSSHVIKWTVNPYDGEIELNGLFERV